MKDQVLASKLGWMVLVTKANGTIIRYINNISPMELDTLNMQMEIFIKDSSDTAQLKVEECMNI